MEMFNRIALDVSLGRSVEIFGFANLYGCTVGDESRIGCFVEIQKNAIVGARCKISSHSFICEGVTIVGAGAVVTKSVASRTVVAGNPARLLRTLGEKEAP